MMGGYRLSGHYVAGGGGGAIMGKTQIFALQGADFEEFLRLSNDAKLMLRIRILEHRGR